jgi:hypothetical protein
MPRYIYISPLGRVFLCLFISFLVGLIVQFGVRYYANSWTCFWFVFLCFPWCLWEIDLTLKEVGSKGIF